MKKDSREFYGMLAIYRLWYCLERDDIIWHDL